MERGSRSKRSAGGAPKGDARLFYGANSKSPYRVLLYVGLLAGLAWAGLASAQPPYPSTDPASPRFAPPGWDSQQVAPQPPQPQTAPTASTPTAAPQPIEGSQLLAQIGSEVLLVSEVLGEVNSRLEEAEKKYGRIPDSEREMVRRQLLKQQLKAVLDSKLLLADALRTIGKDGKGKERLTEINGKIDEQFEKTGLPDLYKKTGTSDRQQLDAELRRLGTSLEKQKQAFRENMLAQQWLRQKINYNPEINFVDIRDRYRQNAAQYDYSAATRWEELAVRFDRFPSQEAAWRAMAEMGNRVQGGEAFSEVAKAHSQGLTAREGGEYDWTSPGSLRFANLEQILFDLPVGELSQIIETTVGFHIVRVTERREAGRTSFTEAQVDIREELRKEQVKKQLQEYLEQLRSQTRVWTMFDNDPPDPIPPRGS